MSYRDTKNISSYFEPGKTTNIFQSARTSTPTRTKSFPSTLSKSSTRLTSTSTSTPSSPSSFNTSKKETFKFTCPICTATFDTATSDFADRHANRCIEQRSLTSTTNTTSSSSSSVESQLSTSSSIRSSSSKSVSSSLSSSSQVNLFQQASISISKTSTTSPTSTTLTKPNSTSSTSSILLQEWQFLKPLESAFPSLQVIDTFSKEKQVTKKSMVRQLKDGENETLEVIETIQLKKKKKQCPAHKWIPNTSFTVDAFNYGEIPGCSAYFLSHFHADHYGGISGKFTYGPLYCSQVTANLLQWKFKKLDPQFIHPLPLNQPTMIQGVEVTCFEANHCPGAIMFIFKVNNKRYLHTGDFRATPQVLKQVLPHHPFDCVFLDTTYLNPEYAFPPQSFILKIFGEMAARVYYNLPIVLTRPKVKRDEPLWSTLTPLPVIDNDPFLPKPFTLHPKLHTQQLFSTSVQNLLIVVGTYTIGKEKLAFEICDRINSLLHCSKAKHAILRCCFPNLVYTPDPLRAQLHLVPMGDLNGPSLRVYLDQFDEHFSHLLAFRPTGWTSDSYYPVRYLSDIQPNLVSKNIAIVDVPYSEHSSFEELRRFILGIEAQHIVPTVRSNHLHIIDDWQLEKKKNGGPIHWSEDEH